MAISITVAQFKRTIRAYYKKNARAMPWRETRDPYRILVSEIMLQQTQVSRVLGFYKNFIKQFPDFRALASASTSDVLRAWQGLGYNRRALALQRLANEVIEKYDGRLPRDTENLIALPGIGPYTAGAVRAFAFDEPEIFIETNIRRVFIYFFFPAGKKPNQKAGEKVMDAALRRYLESTLDRKNPREWYFALMDYGAMLGSMGAENPNRRSAHYARQSIFAGSDRELRGKIVRTLLLRKKILSSALARELRESRERVLNIVTRLNKEGFIMKKGEYITLAN